MPDPVFASGAVSFAKGYEPSTPLVSISLVALDGRTLAEAPAMVDGSSANFEMRISPKALQQASGRAQRIHFNLSGIEDPIVSAAQGERLGFINNNLTNAELNFVRLNAGSKVVFWRDGAIVQSPFR